MAFCLPAAAEDTRCACTEKSFAARWTEADAVLAGEVTDITMVDKKPDWGGDDPKAVVTLRVNEAYKGLADETTFTLHTTITRYTCMGYPFKKGGQYLVFAYARKTAKRDDDALSGYTFPAGTYGTGGLCGGAKPFTAAADDLKIINEKLRSERASTFGGKILPFSRKD
jgi:hypothetical protein